MGKRITKRNLDTPSLDEFFAKAEPAKVPPPGPVCPKCGEPMTNDTNASEDKWKCQKCGKVQDTV